MRFDVFLQFSLHLGIYGAWDARTQDLNWWFFRLQTWRRGGSAGNRAELSRLARQGREVIIIINIIGKCLELTHVILPYLPVSSCISAPVIRQFNVHKIAEINKFPTLLDKSFRSSLWSPAHRLELSRVGSTSISALGSEAHDDTSCTQ